MKYKNYVNTDCAFAIACITLMGITNYLFIGIMGLVFGAMAIYDNKKVERLEDNV